MTSAMTEDRLLEHVRRKERSLLKSISWISIGIAILYVCGYAWRASYYDRIGIPVSFVDFSFPEILIPKPNVFVFMANLFVVIASGRYYDFYTRKKRLRRAKAMGIDAPLEKLHDYAFQKNSSSPNKTNYRVFSNFLEEYVNTYSKDNPQWQFNRDVFDSNVLKLFQDIPSDSKSSFVSYCIQFSDMDESEQNQTIKDAIAWPPKGSKIYERIQAGTLCLLAASFVTLVILREFYFLFSFVCMALGVLTGFFLIKVSKVDARWQMWHSILISILILVILNGVDGYFTTQSKLKNDQFPIAKIVQTDGKEQEGLLLGIFNDGYIIVVSDPNGIYNLRKFHKHSVASLNYTTMERLKRQIEETEKKLQALNEKAKVE